MRARAGLVEIGIALGWLTAAALVVRVFEHGGLSGIVVTALFAWGTIGAYVRYQELSDRCDRYERALKERGVDPRGVY